MTVKVKDHSKGDDLYMKINKISKSFIKKKKFTTPRQRIRKRRLANRSTSASNKNGMSLTGLQFKRKRKPKPKRVGSAKEYKFNFKKFIKYAKRSKKGAKKLRRNIRKALMKKNSYSKINAIPTVSTRKHKNTAGRSDKSLSNNYLRESFTKKTGSKRRKKKKITTSNQQTAQPLLQLKKPSSSRKNVYTSFVSVSKS